MESPAAMSGDEKCEACGRAGLELTRHHLFPVSQHKRIMRRTGVKRQELLKATVWFCDDCHGQLHALVSEKELASSHNTLESIMAHEGFARFVEWTRGRHSVCGHRRCNARRG